MVVQMRILAFLPAVSTLLLATSAYGQDVSFTARLGRNPVGLGDSFPYEVTLSGDSVRPGNYRRPDFRGFRVLSEQPSQSSGFDV